jgi:hypothetical protein
MDGLAFTRNEQVIASLVKGGSSLSTSDGSVVRADWEWHGHVGLWPGPFGEAGQHVAVKVNESEGGGVALPDVVDNIEVEATVRTGLINLAGL